MEVDKPDMLNQSYKYISLQFCFTNFLECTLGLIVFWIICTLGVYALIGF